MSSADLPNSAAKFVESVVALQPAIAVFDCDGTLWSGDSGRDFFYWEMERGLVSPEVAETMRARYKLYESGELGEEPMCGEMVTMHGGLSIADLHQAAEEFFVEVVAPRIFSEMLELTHRLDEQGCELWAVSSTNNWVVEAGAARFRIPRDRVLAACLHHEDGLATDRLHRVPTGDLKAVAIREVIARPVDAVFGNSVHDQAMLEISRHPFCINPNPDLERVAIANRWPIYRPAGATKGSSVHPNHLGE